MTTLRPIVFRPLRSCPTFDPGSHDRGLAPIRVTAPSPLAALVSQPGLRSTLQNLPRMGTGALPSLTPTLVDVVATPLAPFSRNLDRLVPAAEEAGVGDHDHRVGGPVHVDDRAITNPLRETRFELTLLDHHTASFEQDATTVSVFPAEAAPIAPIDLPAEVTEAAAIGYMEPQPNSRSSSFVLGVILASVALLLDALLLASTGFGALIQLVVAGGVGLIFAGSMLLRGVHRARRRREGRLLAYGCEAEVFRFCRP